MTDIRKNELNKLYSKRFDPETKYRNEVWQVLVEKYFQSYVRPNDAVLDLGCGYGVFINNIQCNKKYGIDLNPNSEKWLNSNVKLFNQDSSERWPLDDCSLDVIFTSNFFEHLPNKNELRLNLREAHRCLKEDGQLIALGPNIKYIPGEYWDFWDHSLCLTERSLKEGLESCGYLVDTCIKRFLPYSMVNRVHFPKWCIRLYLSLPFIWRYFGKQFLVIGKKTPALPES